MLVHQRVHWILIFSISSTFAKAASISRCFFSSGLNSQSSWRNTAELGPLPVTQAPQPILWKMVSLVSITSEILNFSIDGINGCFHSDWDLDLNRFEQISAQILSGCGEETRCASHQKEAEAARCRGGPTSREQNGKRLLVEVFNMWEDHGIQIGYGGIS